MKNNKKQQPELSETIHAKHDFSQEELVELSRDIARTCSEITSLEAQKSAVTKDFSGRIESKEIHRDDLVGKVTCCYEMRPTDCLVILDPKNRSKDYFRKTKEGKKGEFVERREMTEADFQLTLEPAAQTKDEIPNPE